jgi:hypothetical protein
MAVTEDQLARWARGPSETEADRCETTVRRITEALRGELGARISVFAQGSYRNKTNVRQDSDVDVVVRDNWTYFSDTGQMSPAALQQYNAAHLAPDHTFEQFKSQAHRLLTATFGTRVQRRNKCIFVPGASTGVNGDVVPAFVHKRFDRDGGIIAEGIEFVADKGGKFDSFPEQHYNNGVAKNDGTSRMFKRMVRILKNVRGALVDQGMITEEAISSFFIECLVFNAPNASFAGDTYFRASKNVIDALWEGTNDAVNNEFVEVNRLKWLFVGERTIPQARAFLQAAYTFIGH